MNNAQKVRIYDLSKELNLENKDILEICTQLNIPVKSHSSTISESQAERLKAMASKYVASQTTEEKEKTSPNEKNTQQILAIHHKQIHKSSSNQASRQPQGSSPTLVAPPRLPTKPQLSRPPVNSQKSPQKASNKEETVVNPSEKPKLTEKTKLSENLITTLVEDSQELEPTPTLLNPPQLSKPLVQSSQKSPSGKSGLKLTSKPEPTERVEPQKKLSLETTSTPKTVSAETPAPNKKITKIKAKLDLQRPQVGRQPKEETLELIAPSVKLPSDEIDDSDVVDDDVLETPLKPKPTLKRPTSARPSKQKKWEEEEEERESKVKNKGAAKAKRRTKRLDEEDEDFESTTGLNPIPLTASLSTARPPKPQSQTKLAAVSKPKKPMPKPDTGGGSTTRQKTERRERQEVIQRPETIILDSNLTVRELANRLQIPETEIIKNLFSKGIAVNITQTLDLETAQLVTKELGVEVEVPEVKAAATKDTEMLDEHDLDNLQRRPPVVTIMGHVDHGKTTLLDSIRQTKVAQGEAGGITQHIGAYHVDIKHNGQSEQIVFLDTPGHEAFTAMRARGTKVTDIAILVVAADDGVQPQTREAISHAKAAKVPLLVAINKVDKPEANPDRIKQELAELGLLSEEWGGETIMVPVSALKGENLDTLLEMIILLSEVEELVANPNRLAKGTVIEANLDRTRGPVATLLIQNGTLRVGDAIVAGSVFGKIRAMIDDRGEKVEAASPSFAVEVLGLSNVPSAGDEFDVYANEKEARVVAEQGAADQRQTRLQQATSSRRVTLSTISAQAQEGELKELNLIVKADVQGSVEAILGSLEQLPQDEVQIRILLAAPGEITETDVDLAAASGAVVIGFNTTLASGSRAAADHEGVDIREYDIIYKLLDDIQGAMEGLLEPEEVESPLGQAEVRAVFPLGRGAVAGCYVQSGKVVRNRFVRVRRSDNIVYQGNLDSLKRVKELAREVNAGYECGVGIDKFSDWQAGDIIEAYEMVMKRRTLAGR
ncbi:translation initiation factor IF-2 [cyanobacterium endosymbiont of Epithemia turgida]|uniref:translation initiation factor IF-2 n=1 Tax=cyanobacterium endosymbiont of Epithemia turgida TaxID=718217 RepID=UPI0004D1BFE4|nr:translation initiation factor IF-2 [cyanobacterium endosymbiont of Epithemia turgida]BAP17240.1 translation initiation factor IF-2 [cyanobacterium endosymbiont of Epithemia turgida isolate EtSB Lake Yunoko]